MTSKSARLEARLSPEHQALIQHAAALRGLSVTDFVVTASLAEAQKIVAANDVIALSIADQRRFAEALLNPKAITPALRQAAADHQRLVEPRE